MVFGELVDGEVNVRIWVHPEHRHRGYGTAALRRRIVVLQEQLAAMAEMNRTLADTLNDRSP